MASPGWQMGTTWQQRQAAGNDWRTQLRPTRTAIAQRQQTGGLQQPGGLPLQGGPAEIPGGANPAAFRPPTGRPAQSLEELAGNWNNSPNSPPGLQGGGPPGLMKQMEDEGMQRFGMGANGGGPPGKLYSRIAALRGGGASGGFGGFQRQPARQALSRVGPRRRKRSAWQ
jgi:hypothetical protein